MFDLRLGLQLGKSLQEIRAIPYPEYKLWKTFYMLEPFGFENIEFHVSQILAQILNVQVSKKSQRKKPTLWMRNMKSLLLKAISKERFKRIHDYQEPVGIKLDTMEKRKQATEEVIKNFKAMFGARVKDNRK